LVYLLILKKSRKFYSPKQSTAKNILLFKVVLRKLFNIESRIKDVVNKIVSDSGVCFGSKKGWYSWKECEF
jgi:hypothetical protein